MNLAQLEATLAALPDKLAALIKPPGSEAAAVALQISALASERDALALRLTASEARAVAAEAAKVESDKMASAAAQNAVSEKLRADTALAAEKDLEKRANVLAEQRLAESGAPALKGGGTADPGNPKPSAKTRPNGPDGKPLTGLAYAIFLAEEESKSKQPK